MKQDKYNMKNNVKKNKKLLLGRNGVKSNKDVSN